MLCGGGSWFMVHNQIDDVVECGVVGSVHGRCGWRLSGVSVLLMMMECRQHIRVVLCKKVERKFNG
jgi:hypothetical protein